MKHFITKYIENGKLYAEAWFQVNLFGKAFCFLKRKIELQAARSLIEIMQRNGSITIKGHAGYAPQGQDIVCAGISALLQTFVASVDKLTDDTIKSDMRAGETVIEYKDLSEQGQLLMKSFFLGCEMIAATYPDYVKMAQAVNALKASGEKEQACNSLNCKENKRTF